MSEYAVNKKYALARALGNALLAKNATVCTVESCTGGGIAFAITDVAGSSAWINQSWVTYSNHAKHDLVGVNMQTLEQHGAVSEEVVREMAEGGRKAAHADYSVAVSGIAGPSGGSADKPVGLVHFAIASEESVIHFKRIFSGNRQEIRDKAIIHALEKLNACLV
ncbi:CinA family protein [Ningiella sp. W23]|uniref:CinA family protein n=1 Tax=Ningiella sp. W23 TaxID=3023715 RepID=UPI0037563EB6